MTEAEWVASEDPAAMEHCLVAQSVPGNVDGLVTRPSERKLRLWVEACRGYAERAAPELTWKWGNLDSRPTLGDCLATWAGESFAPLVPRGLRAYLLRDIVGSPFRPVAFRMPPDCDYRSDLWGLASGLAQAAYEERDPQTGHLDPLTLAAVADALEEAGCDSEPLLRHLRGWEWVRGKFSDSWFWHRADAPHVRGCWAVDAVLGRE